MLLNSSNALVVFCDSSDFSLMLSHRTFLSFHAQAAYFSNYRFLIFEHVSDNNIDSESSQILYMSASVKFPYQFVQLLNTVKQTIFEVQSLPYTSFFDLKLF